MNRTPLKVATLISAALTLGMHFAHALELRPKLAWSKELYMPVQVSLYEWFGVVGPVLEVLTLILVIALAVKLRRQVARFRPLMVTLAMLIVGLIVWVAFVATATSGIAGLVAGTTPADDWLSLRAQWQYAQTAIFILQLVGFGALALAVARPQPDP